ncbi:MAG TPA: glycosyltransferase family 4 protein [Candidatus Binataceae bacterium]|nr:glycosyltransferase family 4 protein [Candidatus Binataceae bacterium]
MRVVVAHPVRQHSHQLAAALEAAGMLQIYMTMLPAREDLARWPPILSSALTRLAPGLDFAELPPRRTRSFTAPWIFKRSLDRLSGTTRNQTSETLAFAIFDQWVARQIHRLRPSVVVGYEIASTATFAAARRVGAKCILDAAAFASGLQDERLISERRMANTAVGRWIRRRKAAEVAMADMIVCCSDIAAKSYIAAGVAPERVVVNPLGCDVAWFASVARSAEGAPRFCFVGAASETKGFGDLLAAVAACRRSFPALELHVIGDPQAARRFGARDGQDGIILHGKKSHGDLAILLARMDVLVLPSILDSFGMVVPEAVAAGAFVIVTDMVGAGMIVDDERVGAIVAAGDLEALGREMLKAARNIDQVRAEAQFRRQHAQDWDWLHYRRAQWRYSTPYRQIIC